MFKLISVAALASILSGCGMPDHGKLSSESVKPGATHVAIVAPTAARSAAVSEPQTLGPAGQVTVEIGPAAYPSGQQAGSVTYS